MADDNKADPALAAKDAEIADLKAQLAAVGRGPDAGADVEGDVRARAVAEAEARDAMTPSPTQAELDSAKLGEAAETTKAGRYRNRQDTSK